jgi:hypothetical protein
MEFPLAKSPCLRDTSSLDALHLPGAADNDPGVEPSGIDRLSKRDDVAPWRGEAQIRFVSLHHAWKRHATSCYFLHLPHDAMFEAERRTGIPAHQSGPHACCVGPHDRPPSAKSSLRNAMSESAVASGSEL